MTMKRHILAFSVLASILCSCQKSEKFTPVGEESLKSYAYSLFYDAVAGPAIAMDLAYEFQDFLNLGDEQREKHSFANMVVQYDLNKYALLFYDGTCNLIIDTNGSELGASGKEWDIYFESGQLFNYLKMDTPYYNRYSDINFKIACKEGGQWEINSDLRNGTCRLTLAADNPENRVWLAAAKGSETEAGASGIRSDYQTCNIKQEGEDFEISFQKHADNAIQACSFNGTLRVLISSFDQIKERALVIGKPGFAVNCITEIWK